MLLHACLMILACELNVIAPSGLQSWDRGAQGRYLHRAVAPVRVLAEIGRGNPRDDCWLNHPGVTLKNPLNDTWTLTGFRGRQDDYP